MTLGISPIDNAFELIGLHHCSSLMRYIFVESLAGKVIFILGFLLSLSRSLKASNFSPVIIFCSIFFSFLFLLVIPKSLLSPSLSAMEERGFSGISTESILRKAGIEQISASPVLGFLAHGVAAFSSGAVAVIDLPRVRNSSFLKDPFRTFKLWLLTRDRLHSGINDPLLTEKLTSFYQDHYFPALRVLKEKGIANGPLPWPGDEDILSVYSSQGASDWRALQGDLYGLINSDGLFDHISSEYYQGSSLNDAAVRALIETDTTRVFGRYTALSFSGKTDLSRDSRLNDGSRTVTMVDQISRTWLMGYPVVYGLCLWSVWAAFPFVLVFLFLSADMTLLAVFLKYFLIVKLIPVFWVFSDRISMLVFDIATAFSGGKVFLWDMPIVGITGLLGMVVFVICVLVFLKRKVTK